MIRIGTGYDSHVFEEGRELFLGGVKIEGCVGLKGHSDADVLLHAIIDALYGAVAKGDIGAHFPDSDEKWRGADSTRLLESCVEELAADGWQVVNMDATVICERPKLRPYIDVIRARIAGLLRCNVECVSVKGKTNEKMDDVGAGKGIMVHAAVLVER